ncbi:hypothetical protein PIB30_082481 [Stylosanthes scabra]|uniref:Uncharacterized protein n=1 Tax=Stylosanthes scabra TaxID=79078 RepID=A0ABU6XRK5_9FABA|nr:hypothetical protein [Stylosanthes scabra]
MRVAKLEVLLNAPFHVGNDNPLTWYYLGSDTLVGVLRIERFAASETTRLPTKVIYEFDFEKHVWVEEIITKVIHTIHEHRNVVGHLQQPSETLIGTVPPSPKELQSNEVIYVSSNLELEEDDQKVLGGDGTLKEESLVEEKTLHVSTVVEEDAYDHLIRTPFTPGYTIWARHGEVPDEETPHSGRGSERYVPECDQMRNMVHEAFSFPIQHESRFGGGNE